MIKASHLIKLPGSLKDAVARLALEDEVSMNHWMAAAIAQKVDMVETGTLILKRRGAAAVPADMLALLDRASREDPPLGDEL